MYLSISYRAAVIFSIVLGRTAFMVVVALVFGGQLIHCPTEHPLNDTCQELFWVSSSKLGPAEVSNHCHVQVSLRVYLCSFGLEIAVR